MRTYKRIKSELLSGVSYEMELAHTCEEAVVHYGEDDERRAFMQRKAEHHRRRAEAMRQAVVILNEGGIA